MGLCSKFVIYDTGRDTAAVYSKLGRSLQVQVCFGSLRLIVQPWDVRTQRWWLCTFPLVFKECLGYRSEVRGGVVKFLIYDTGLNSCCGG